MTLSVKVTEMNKHMSGFQGVYSPVRKNDLKKHWSE